jgi:hypothetical protein
MLEKRFDQNKYVKFSSETSHITIVSFIIYIILKYLRIKQVLEMTSIFTRLRSFFGESDRLNGVSELYRL